MFLRKPRTGAAPPPVNLRTLDARWHAFNQPFTINDNLGPDKGSCVLLQHGTRSLVFSAPHAVHHHRQGMLKTNDANTGGLALALAKQCGASAIAMRRGGREFGDPNADLDHPLKTEARTLVGPGVVFVDLHGMADRDEDVIIGLGATVSPEAHRLATEFVRLGTVNGIVARIADAETGFNAKGPATMTTWASSHGADALQFEIARRLRSVKAPAERRMALLRTFVDVFAI